VEEEGRSRALRRRRIFDVAGAQGDTTSSAVFKNGTAAIWRQCRVEVCAATLDSNKVLNGRCGQIEHIAVIALAATVRASTRR